VPVLAEEAIHGTAFVKHGKVVAVRMFVSIAYPIRYTVCGQRIPIKFQHPFFRGACKMLKPAVLNGT
jgi:hypothetical protein